MIFQSRVWRALRSKYILGGLTILLGLALITPVYSTPNLSIDGTASNSCSGLTSCSVTPFGTSNPNDVIVVLATTFAVTFNTPTDVQGHLSFALRKTFTAGVTDSEWWAVASTALSGDTITLTSTSGPASIGLVVWGINGANTMSPFDPSSGVPATNSGTATCSTPCIYPVTGTISSTSNGNDMILGLAGDDLSNVLGADSGFTLIAITAVAAAEFEVVTSTQTGLSVPMSLSLAQIQGTGTANWVMIVDAVQGLPIPPIPEYPLGISVLAISTILAYAVIKRSTITK
jgi:hypothetical protein